MAPQRLEKIESAPEMVWSRKPRTHKMWYTGAQLTVPEAARMTKLPSCQKKAPKALKSLDAELKSAPVPAERWEIKRGSQTLGIP